jgi:hypothetical protein
VGRQAEHGSTDKEVVEGAKEEEACCHGRITGALSDGKRNNGQAFLPDTNLGGPNRFAWADTWAMGVDTVFYG